MVHHLDLGGDGYLTMTLKPEGFLCTAAGKRSA